MTGERDALQKFIGGIRRKAAEIPKKIRLMEVCGTHTVSIFREGIRQVLPQNVELVSGPGCPVCVTPDGYIDAAIEYAKMRDVTVATFGDMMKVPGSHSSLSAEPDADVRVVYSPMDALALAESDQKRRVVFLAVGFETTAPTAAAALIEARRRGLLNFSVFAAERLVPPALMALLADGDAMVDGFLLPGHVAVITGSEAFGFLPDMYHIGGVVAGFSAVRILQAIYLLLCQVEKDEAAIQNAYADVVRPGGNRVAREMVSQVFELSDAEWRGLGVICDSGLSVRDEYSDFDASKIYPVDTGRVRQDPQKSACRCGEVLRGRISPPECPLFGKGCVPEHARGPCMVSVEGVCAAWYRYGRGMFRYGED